MEPLKKVQVEGYVMFAEPEVLFGNLDELCCVSINSINSHQGQDSSFNNLEPQDHICM